MTRRVAVAPEPWMVRTGLVPALEVSGNVRTLYVAGVTAVDNEGKPVHEGDMRAQLAYVIDLLEATLKQAGYALGDIVRLTTYTTDMDTFREVRPQFQSRFDDAQCQYAASLIGVSRLARPQDLLELEATAVRPA